MRERKRIERKEKKKKKMSCGNPQHHKLRREGVFFSRKERDLKEREKSRLAELDLYEIHFLLRMQVNSFFFFFLIEADINFKKTCAHNTRLHVNTLPLRLETSNHQFFFFFFLQISNSQTKNLWKKYKGRCR